MSLIANYKTFIPSGGGSVSIAIGSGKILSIIMSTEETANVQKVIFYDSLSASGNVLLSIRCPLTSPYSLFFASSRPLTFSTGLTVNPGNCNVHLTLVVK